MRPFADLRPTGLLWLINTTVFHPRGYALALHFDESGDAVGWSLLGAGSTPWSYDHCDPGPHLIREGLHEVYDEVKAKLNADARSFDELFAAVKELMP